ncbi:hypothetical protein CVT24_000496 [Panaeolus cyanescens]|uniref:Spc7 kinetochore protein domain-containing protein n=1 Tax=Panaeolus cyanescens TaxID=181874 RepID=A0A409V8E6_9AGAR|nr:hypothetical protein CVT24_000496 [Panaeolus cyanescens]
MAAKKTSPNRRRSIAVPNQNQPSIVPKNRRRAHSIVPGLLSPQSKARRSLVPRKSILKASINTFHLDNSSQQSTNTNDDGNATKSTDFTQDFTAPVHDNTSRKSLGRRVSFASHSHVRMFETIHTNSTGSPQSSPGSSIGESPEASPVVEQEPTDENQYPGRNQRNRRSSIRFSMGQSEDMDLTTIAGNPFQNRGSAILDEEFDYDNEDDEDMYDEEDDNMDVTEAIKGPLSRKRSLSMPRQPLQQLSGAAADEQVGDESRSDIGNDSIISDAPSEQSQAMEFTIPLGQSLRPAEKDEAWLALKEIANTNSEPSGEECHQEDDEMELGDAIDRLRRARDSLALPDNLLSQEDSFMSTEDSFDDDAIDRGDKTLNLSQVFGRASMVSDSRLSLGQESNMDESEVYGNIGTSSSNPRMSIAPTTTSVFQPPTSNPPPAEPQPTTSASASTTVPSAAFTFKPRPPSPVKPTTPHKSPAKAKPTFSAAFAPPVARPSPRKSIAEVPSTPTQSKRLRPVPEESHPDNDLPSPAKRQALASKWQPDVPSTSAPKAPSEPTAPKPLSPDRTAPFQQPAPSSLRRPSGYFARRKSLAAAATLQTQAAQSQDSAPGTLTPTPKKKLPFRGLGRASMGSAPAPPAPAFKPLSKEPLSINPPKSPAKQPSEKEVEAAHCVREATRQAVAVPSPTRGSPAPRVRIVEPEPNVPAEPSVTIDSQNMGELSGEMEVDIDATQQWRDAVRAAEPAVDEEEVPSISITQFLSMTNIKFMDELTAPRKSMHPSQQTSRQPRNPSEIPMADYVVAMAIDVPQLELYTRVSRDLEAWMAKSKSAFAEAEEEASKLTPELFVEYARADEEGQHDLIHLLNLIKTNTRYQARSDWYDWKLQWVEGLWATANEGFSQLENDARILEDMKKSVDDLVPQLEKEYADLVEQLEQEQAEVAEIEAGDQEYLNDLKATIAEQNIEVEALKAELKDGKDQLRWLQEKAEEIGAQKREARSTIEAAQKLIQMKQTSTRAEVFRLKGELEALEKLHRMRIVKVDSRLFEYIFANRLKVSIPCRNFLPSVNKVSIMRLGKSYLRYKDDFPPLSRFLLSTAQTVIRESDEIVTVRQIVHKLSDYWSACTQLRSQLSLISVRYPVEILLPPTTSESLPSFKARVMVMLPSCKGKAYISFTFNLDTFSRWPMSINSLDCEVEVAYGSISRESILQAVVSRVSEATPTENFACLLDACIEAESTQPTS